MSDSALPVPALSLVRSWATECVAQCDCRAEGPDEYEPCGGCSVFLAVNGHVHPKVWLEDNVKPCGTCGGSGEIEDRVPGRSAEGELVVSPCPACDPTQGARANPDA